MGNLYLGQSSPLVITIFSIQSNSYQCGLIILTKWISQFNSKVSIIDFPPTELTLAVMFPLPELRHSRSSPQYQILSLNPLKSTVFQSVTTSPSHPFLSIPCHYLSCHFSVDSSSFSDAPIATIAGQNTLHAMV